MTPWVSDTELFTLCRTELYTAVVGDICDQLGLRHQFLPPSLRPLLTGTAAPLLAGRAMTVLEADIFTDEGDDAPFGLMLQAIDDLQADEIYVCAGSSPRYALVGELMCTAMRHRGAVGAVCDGYVRDTSRLVEMAFPVFALGSYAQDQRGRGKVLAYRVPIEIGGVRITPGDILIGDVDGVVVVPQASATEVFTRALAKARAENAARTALEQGMSAVAAFTSFGVL